MEQYQEYLDYKSLCKPVDEIKPYINVLDKNDLLVIRTLIKKCLQARIKYSKRFFDGSLDIPHCMYLSKLNVLKEKINNRLEKDF